MSKEMLFGGYIEDSSKSTALKFGLNQKVKLIKFEYNPSISFKEDSPGSPGIETEISINGLVLKNTIFLVNKAFDKGNEITDPTHSAFIKEVNNMKQRIFHIVKCFASKEQIIETVMQKVPFGQFVKNLKDIFEEGWEEKELDLFLQYQWQLKEGSDRKFLEVPKKTKQGFFLIPHVEGNFKEVKINNGVAKVGDDKLGDVSGKKLKVGEDVIILPTAKTALCYINENNEVHPFAREEWFMENGWGQADDGAEDALDNGSW